uniref:Retrotransposon gag domain-containing protein n=1 Tax=Brassica oleracea var. oleracea TaxID=109376 RepID=A0A0D3AUV6_BRAOL
MAGVEFLVFDGASGDLRPWISALEDQFATDDYSNLNKLALAVYLIGGKAEAFVHHRQESKYFYTWDDFKSSLLLRFGERDDPERIRLLAERDKSVLNGRNSETIKNTDAIQEVKEHIVNLEPNELHQEESALNATKTNVDQEMEVVCSIQDKILLEEINSVLETDGVHPREAIPKSQVLVSSTKSDYGEILFKSCSMNRITANQIDLVKNIECFDVAWLFSSRNLMDSVRVRDEFSKSLSDTESIGNAHQMYDRKSLRATSSEKHMKQLKCWKFKFKRKKLTGTRQKIEQHKLVISVTNLGQNEKRFSDLADRLQKANTVSDRCSGVQNIHGAVLWFNYKQKYSMRNLSLMMKCSKKKERFDEAGRRYDIARSASVRYGGIQDVESTFSQLEGSYDEHMMLTENVGPDNSDEVVSCWISIPVTSLNQKEPERLIGLVDTVHRRAVSQDQVLYADLSSDNMTLVPDVNLQKHLMLQQVLVSDWRLRRGRFVTDK